MRSQWWVLGAVALVLAGCGGGKPKQRPSVTITGRVVDTAGKPVGNMMLSFAPIDAVNKDERPMAQVEADGTFRATCVPGRYKVTMVAIPKTPGSAPDEGNVTTPEKAKVITKSNPMEMAKGTSQPSWDIEVKLGGNDEFKLQVK